MSHAWLRVVVAGAVLTGLVAFCSGVSSPEYRGEPI